MSVQINTRFPEDLISKVDELVLNNKYISRGEAIRTYVRRGLVTDKREDV